MFPALSLPPAGQGGKLLLLCILWCKKLASESKNGPETTQFLVDPILAVYYLEVLP
jgi:hypothetical protein